MLIRNDTDHWVYSLRERWKDTQPILLKRVILMPLRPHREFLELLRIIDILLDSSHFGSGNTMYEAMLVSTPIVTWPGAFMRARIVAAAYHQMAIPDPPIADTMLTSR